MARVHAAFAAVPVVALAATAWLAACDSFESTESSAADAAPTDGAVEGSAADGGIPDRLAPDCSAPRRPALPDGGVVLLAEDFESADPTCSAWTAAGAVPERIEGACGRACRICSKGGSAVLSREIGATSPGRIEALARVRNHSSGEAKASIVVYYAGDAGGSDRQDAVLAQGQSDDAVGVSIVAPKALARFNVQYIVQPNAGCIEIDDVRITHEP